MSCLITWPLQAQESVPPKHCTESILHESRRMCSPPGSSWTPRARFSPTRTMTTPRAYSIRQYAVTPINFCFGSKSRSDGSQRLLMDQRYAPVPEPQSSVSHHIGRPYLLRCYSRFRARQRGSSLANMFGERSDASFQTTNKVSERLKQHR